MAEELLIRHCAPTLAGLKTGSLFSCAMDGGEDLPLKINAMDEMLSPKGVRVCLLSVTPCRALVYVYRPERLAGDLNRPEARELLCENGYQINGVDGIIAQLSERIGNRCEFPHEIGLFLSYPIDDIRAFIANKGKNCLCTGCWKVYCNEGEALKTFKRFKKCTDIYCKKFNEGSSIARLTVVA
jgi:hypothetical protein